MLKLNEAINMDELKKEKIRLTVKQILLSLLDGVDTLGTIFGYRYQKREAYENLKSRAHDSVQLNHALWQLEKQGYIKQYKSTKRNIIKLTKIGKEKAIKYVFEDHKVKIPKKWDKKWRMIIFDIPEDKKRLRDILRDKLKYWGFFQLQKSVFVYPFDCQKEVSALKYLYNLSPYMQYIVADSIETEIDLASYFYDLDILSKKNL